MHEFSFDQPELALDNFAFGAGGRTSDDRYPRRLADVNGDGNADTSDFGNNGVLVAISNDWFS